MTPAQLYAALDARRIADGRLWWQVCVVLDIDEKALRRMRDGKVSAALRQRCEEFLRRPVPPQQE